MRAFAFFLVLALTGCGSLHQPPAATPVAAPYSCGAAIAGEELLTHPGVEHDLLFRSLEIIKGLGAPAIAMVHCEDQDLIWVLEDRLKAAGRTDLRAWAEARPGWIEHLRMRIAYDVARAVGVPLYCVHIAAAEGVDLMAEARQAGYPYWGETCPHYLTHTADMEDEIGAWGRVNTSIKFERDRDRIGGHREQDQHHPARHRAHLIP